MIKRIKRILEQYFPYIVAAIREFRSARQLRTGEIRNTPYNFRLIGNEEMQDGTFEPEETKLIMHYLNTTDVFVDIGANIGYYTCLSRSLGIKTIAIEPLAQNLNFLYANLNVNGWQDVEVFPLGLASRPGIATLYGGSTGASLVNGWAENSENFKRTIPLSTLDTLIGPRFIGEKLFIKMDVEGAEYSVMRGAMQTLLLTPSPVWLLEICFKENFREGINPFFKDIFELFTSHGYAARTVGEGSRAVLPGDVERWVSNLNRDFGYVNYIFEKPVDLPNGQMNLHE